MNPTKHLALSRKETGISSIFPVTHLNSPTIFETKEGLIGSTIKLKGVSFVIETSGVLNQLSNALHQAFRCFDENYINYVTVHHRKIDVDLKGEFKTDFAKSVNEKYHARFKGKNLFCNDLFVTVILKGDTSTREGKALSFLKRFNKQGLTQNREKRREQQCKELNAKVSQFLALLSAFKPTLLGTNDVDVGHSELISFLSLIPNAGIGQSMPGNADFAPMANYIPDSISKCELYPNGALGQYITSNRLLFGEYIQFQGPSKKDVNFGVMLSVKKYPTDTSCICFDPLLGLDCEFISTHTFAAEEKNSGLDKVDKRRSKLISSEHKGGSQIEALTQLEDEVASEQKRIGYHHNSIMLIASNTELLESAINESVKAYSLSGTTLVRETIGLEAAFWAQIPGLHRMIARSSLITSKNFVDFCSMHNYQTGYRDGNFLGSAVTLLETPSRTSVYINLHTKGSKTNPSNGMTLCIAGTDGGKSVLSGFLTCQMGRYDGRMFFIERDLASRLYVLADGGRYLEIHPEKMEHCSLNPFQMSDTKENRAFIKQWFAALVLRANEETLPAELSKVISECVDYAFDCLQKEHRTLSNVSKLLPTDFERWAELEAWLRSDETRNEGEHAWLFDNINDALSFDVNKFGLDVTYLMDHTTPNISTPVYMYLIHRIVQSMDGDTLTSIIIDEFQQVLTSPFWVTELKKKMPTIRKNKGHFIFMTQSPEKIAESSACADIIGNNATKFLLPNPNASKAVYQELFDINAEEFSMIKETPISEHLVLYKQADESIICKVDLSDLQDELRIFSANKETNKLLDKIISEVGEEPNVWLPEFIKRSAV